MTVPNKLQLTNDIQSRVNYFVVYNEQGVLTIGQLIIAKYIKVVTKSIDRDLDFVKCSIWVTRPHFVCK